MYLHVPVSALRFPTIALLTAMLLSACGEPVSPPGPPAQIESVSPTVFTDTVGTSIADSLVVRVTDARGKPVPGVAVEWTGDGMLTAAAPATDEKGLSRAIWTLGTRAGEQQAKARIGTTEDAPGVLFTATALPGPAVKARRQFATPFPRRILMPGDTLQLQQNWAFFDQHRNLFFGKPTWKSSKPQVVEIGPDGVATGRGGGVSVITMTLDQARDSILVVAGPLRFGEISSGGTTCGMASDSAVVCGITALTAGTPAFQTISVGAGASICALTAEGQAHCWGRSGLPGVRDLTLAMISAGSQHTCGVTTSGAAYCWGLNDHQQLGAGVSTTSSSVPVPVSGGLRFRSVSADGDLHTCGITTEGAAYCWGYNGSGQLGAGLDPATVKDAPAPVPVAGALRFRSIVGFGQSTCGLTEAGQAYCWGKVDHQTIGLESAAMDTCSPINNPHPCRQTPAPVQGGHAFQSLDASAVLACGLTPEGRIYCWGLPVGSVIPRLMEGAPRLRTVDVGVNGIWDWHQDWNTYPGVCGLAEDGMAYCWNGKHGWFRVPGQ